VGQSASPRAVATPASGRRARHLPKKGARSLLAGSIVQCVARGQAGNSSQIRGLVGCGSQSCISALFRIILVVRWNDTVVDASEDVPRAWMDGNSSSQPSAGSGQRFEQNRRALRGIPMTNRTIGTVAMWRAQRALVRSLLQVPPSSAAVVTAMVSRLVLCERIASGCVPRRPAVISSASRTATLRIRRDKLAGSPAWIASRTSMSWRRQDCHRHPISIAIEGFDRRRYEHNRPKRIWSASAASPNSVTRSRSAPRLSIRSVRDRRRLKAGARHAHRGQTPRAGHVAFFSVFQKPAYR
jgi:hypothetical protein